MSLEHLRRLSLLARSIHAARGRRWRWNAAGVWQWRLRFTQLDCVRDLTGVRMHRGVSWASWTPANDVSKWGRK